MIDELFSDGLPFSNDDAESEPFKKQQITLNHIFYAQAMQIALMLGGQEQNFDDRDDDIENKLKKRLDGHIGLANLIAPLLYKTGQGFSARYCKGERHDGS